MESKRAGLIVLGFAVAVAATPLTSLAQDYGGGLETGVSGPWVWNIGGSIAFPLGASSDRANVGGGFVAGLTRNLNPNLGAQFEFGANWASLKGPFGGSDLSGHGFLDYFNLNAMIHAVPAGKGRSVGLYLVGGGGLYYRSATVTQFQGTAVVPYCDPYLFFCSATPVAASSVVGSRSSWDWGLDAGLGMTFGTGGGPEIYLEARYHYIFGPSFTTSGGKSESANGQYLPITLGIRF